MMRMIHKSKTSVLWKSTRRFNEEWLNSKTILRAVIIVITMYRIQTRHRTPNTTWTWANHSSQNKPNSSQTKFPRQISTKQSHTTLPMIYLMKSNSLPGKWKKMRSWIGSKFSKRRSNLRIVVRPMTHPITITWTCSNQPTDNNNTTITISRTIRMTALLTNR